MKDIRVYDFDFNFLCIINDVISVDWKLRYNEVGSFEGRFAVSEKICKSILSKRYVVVVQGDMQAICVGKVVSRELRLIGRSVSWLLTRRVRPPFKTSELFEEYTDPESLLLYMLKKGFTEPPKILETGEEDPTQIDEKRRVDNFILPEPVGAPLMTRHFWRTGANSIEQISADLCDMLFRGHRVIFDISKKEWRFEFIFPRINDNIIISPEVKTAYDTLYSEYLLNYATGGWYPEYTETNVFDAVWKYYSKEDKTGIYLWDSTLAANCESEAQKQLKTKNFVSGIDAKMQKYTYGSDYAIGDVVKAYVKFGDFCKTCSCMISGVNIKITPEQLYEEPILKEYEIIQ